MMMNPNSFPTVVNKRNQLNKNNYFDTTQFCVSSADQLNFSSSSIWQFFDNFGFNQFDGRTINRDSIRYATSSRTH
jgi:hypothetical protein